MLKAFDTFSGSVALGLTLALVSVAMPATPAQAQTLAPPQAQEAAPVTAPAKTTAQKEKAPAQKAPALAPASGGGDAGLRQRVEQLEEQIVDMQVVIGTLESLAKAPPPSASAAPSRGPGDGADSARVDRLEQQLQALTTQMQQMSNRSPASQPDRRSEPAPVTGAMPPASGAMPPASRTMPPASAGMPPAPASMPPAAATGSVSSFGSTTVTSDPGDPIGGIIAGNAPPAKAGEALPELPAAGGAPPGPVAALNPAEGGDPQQMYSSAYGFLLGQNYGAAQSGFEEFLRQYPRDARAPDALFWLGEAHYMQKNFKDAAEAFELVTASYGASTKAPEAQLRRAASLVQLGRKDDACAALRQLATKYPNARPVLKTKADAERQRAGCT